jgi:hypothetical protein
MQSSVPRLPFALFTAAKLRDRRNLEKDASMTRLSHPIRSPGIATLLGATILAPYYAPPPVIYASAFGPNINIS